MNQHLRFCGVSLSTIVCASLVGCMSMSGVRDNSHPSGTTTTTIVSPLAVSVADPAQLATINALLVSAPSFDASARSGDIEPSNLQTLIETAAQRELGLKVLGRDWFEKAKASMGLARNANLANNNLSFPLTSLQTAYLERNGIDGLLNTELLHFDERSGSAVGGEPATVAFRMSVTRISDGKQVWQGTYSYKQEALTDNLLKLSDRFGKGGGGPGWTTGLDVLDRGVSSALKDFGTRREQQFLAQKSPK